MKKKLYLLSLILLTIALSGCTANVSYKVNDDLSISESAKVSMDYSNVTNVFYSTSELFNNIVASNKTILNDNGFKYIINTNNTNDYFITTSNTYTNCDDLISKNTYIKNLFEKVECNNNNGVITIQTSGEIYNTYSEVHSYVDSAVISIDLPFKVLNSNASSVAKSIYTWNINSNTSDGISISFDTKQNIEKSNNITLIVSIVLGITFAIVLIIMYINFNKKKNNEI